MALIDWNDVLSVSAPAFGGTGLAWNVKHSDTFNRADGALGTMDGALGGTGVAWENASVQPVIVSNALAVTDTTTYVRGITATSPNQGMRAKVTVMPAGQSSFWNLRRTSFAATTQRYAMVLSSAGTIVVQKSGSTIARTGGTGGGVTAGDVVEFRVRDVGADALVEVLVNGVIAWSRTDSSPVTISGVMALSAAVGQTAFGLDDMAFLEYTEVSNIIGVQIGPNVVWAAPGVYTAFDEKRRNLFPFIFEGTATPTETVPGWIRGTRETNGATLRILGLGMYQASTEVLWLPNTSYRVTFRARRSAGMGAVALYARPTLNTSTGESTIISSVNLSTTATTHSFTFTTPNTAFSTEPGIAIRAGGTSGLVGDWVEIERDSVMVSVVADTDPAFNGNSTPENAELQKYEWVGLEYASQSVLLEREYNGGDPDPEDPDPSKIVNKALTSNVATLTTEAPHGFLAGAKIVVAEVDSTFDGEYTIATVPTPTTFTYPRTASNVASVATATGKVVAGGDGGDPDPDDAVGRLYHLSFDSWPSGNLTTSQIASLALASATPGQGVTVTTNPLNSGASVIVTDPEGGRTGKRYIFRASGVGNDSLGGGTSGHTWRMRFPSKQIATCQYRLRFGPNFDWRHGGKLPGLTGGTAPDGGNFYLTGYSGRYMWQQPVNGLDGQHPDARGGFIVYLYHAEQQQQPGLPKPGGGVYVQGQCYGDGVLIPTVLGGSTKFGFERERDYIITQTVTMNTPGIRDGRMEVWIDEGSGPVKRLSRPTMYRRADYYWATDNVYESVFFGGNKEDYHNARNQSDVIMDDQKVWSRRIYS